jgi:hypothetical protein
VLSLALGRVQEKRSTQHEVVPVTEGKREYRFDTA